MKRLTQAQSELIDAFLAEHGARVSTVQLEKDFPICMREVQGRPVRDQT